MTSAMKDSGDIAARADAAAARLSEARASIARSIIGLDEVVERTLAVILAGGHGLLVGAPGLETGKNVVSTRRGRRCAHAAGPSAKNTPRLHTPMTGWPVLS